MTLASLALAPSSVPHVYRSCLGLSINALTHIWHFSLVGNALCFGAFVTFPVLCFPASFRVCVSLFASLSLCLLSYLDRSQGFSLLSRYMPCSATSHCFAAPAVFLYVALLGSVFSIRA